MIPRQNAISLLMGCLLVVASGLAVGCQSSGGKPLTAAEMVPFVPTQITQGDVIEIRFPSAPNLDGTHKVGPDGTLILPLVGKVEVAGKTTEQLREQLLKLYESELQEQEVLISLAASANVVWVTGMVLRPGRVPMDRPMTALEGIMEAGGFQPTANLKKVSVIRYEGEQNSTYILNLEPVLTGGPVSPFYLKPRDIIHVPQKVEWF